LTHKHIKRVAALIVILLIVTSSFFFWNDRAMAKAFDTEEEFFQYVESVGKPRVTDDMRYYANWQTYEEYYQYDKSFIAYGPQSGGTRTIKDSQENDLTNPCGLPEGTEVNEYLGYNESGQGKINNPCYPNDAHSGMHPRYWSYDYLGSEALSTWKLLSDAQENHLKNSPLSGNGASFSDNFTVEDINSDYKNYVRVDIAPTWNGQAVVYTENGGSYHASFESKVMAGDPVIDGEIKVDGSTSNQSFDVPPETDRIDVPIEVVATADMHDYMEVQNVNEINATFTSFENTTTGETRTIGTDNPQAQTDQTSVTDSIPISRNELSPGTYNFNVYGQVSVESYYGDRETKNVESSFSVTIVPNYEKGFRVSPSSIQLKQGDFEYADSFFYIETQGERKVTSASTWTSSNDSIVKVNDGRVEAIAPGTVTLTVDYTYDGESYSGTVDVTVYDLAGPNVDFSFSPSSPKALEDVCFDDESTHPEGLDITKREWETAGEVFSSSKEPCYSYETKGNKSVTLTVWDENGKSSSATKTVPVEEPNIKPVAGISGDETVYLGDTKTYFTSSYDQDGEIVNWFWDLEDRSYVSDFNSEDYIDEKQVTLTFDQKTGTTSLWHGVRDNRGGTDEDLKEIVIEEPMPDLKLSLDGERKVNRKMTLDLSESRALGSSPLDWSSLQLEIKEFEGDSSNVYYKGNATDLTAAKTKAFLVKKDTKYEINASLQNEYGNTDKESLIIDALPDIKPVSVIDTFEKIYREKEQYGDHFAVLELTNKSYSKDGDEIGHVEHTVIFDQNNNRDFTDDSSFIVSSKTHNIGQKYSYDHPLGFTLYYTIQSDHSLLVETPHVGRYKTDSKVVETFSNTIPEFVDSNDYMKDQVTTIVEVGNKAPSIEFSQ